MNVHLVRKWSFKRVAVIVAVAFAVVFFYVQFTAAATYTWDGGGGDGLWSTCANWSSNVCPTSADIALFNNTFTGNATLDAAFAGSVGGVSITAGYTGTITQQRDLTIGSSDFIQAGGTWLQGTYGFDAADVVTVSGGVFTAGAGVSTVGGNFTISGGTVAATSSRLITFDSSSDSTLTCTGGFPFKIDISKNAISGAGTDFTLAAGCSATTTNITSGGGTGTNGNNIYTISGTLSSTDFEIGLPSLVVNGTFDYQGATTTATARSITVGSAGVLKAGATSLMNLTGNLNIAATANVQASSLTLISFTSFQDSILTCTGVLPYEIDISKNANSAAGADFTLATGCTATSTNITSGGGSSTNGNNIYTINGTLNTDDFAIGLPSVVVNGTFNYYGTTTTATARGLTVGSGAVLNAGVTTAVDLWGNFTISSGGTLTASSLATMNVGGNYQNSGTFSSGSLSSVTFDDDQNATLTCTGTFPYSIVIGKQTNSGAGSDFTLSSGCTATATSITSGTGSDAVNIYTINGTLTTPDLTFIPQMVIVGTTTFTGTSASYGSLTVNSGGTLRLTGSQTLTPAPTLSSGSRVQFYGSSTYTSLAGLSAFHHLSFAEGTYNVAGSMTVAGNFSNSGATVNQTSGTTTFSGTTNTILGSNAFYNFSKNTGASSTIIFGAGSTQTVNGRMTLRGVDGTSRLSLRSSSPGTRWTIAPLGDRNFNYLRITDGRNTAPNLVNCYDYDCVDGGNNQGFAFTRPEPTYRLRGGVRLPGGVRL